MATEATAPSGGENESRLSGGQEDVLYKIALRQDDYGWEPTNMLLSDLRSNDMLMDMVGKGMLDYSVINPRGKHEIVSLAATMKGIRYCAEHADEISRRVV